VGILLHVEVYTWSICPSVSLHAYRFLVGRPEGKKQHGRRWEDNVNVNRKQITVVVATVNSPLYPSTAG
jgi:hypothetical protein